MWITNNCGIVIKYTDNTCEREDLTMEGTLERWVSMREITAYLGINRDTVLTWIEKRGMPAVKVGRLLKFKISEVDEWMKAGRAAE